MLRVELRPHKMHTLKPLPPGPPDGGLVWRRAFTDDRVEMRSPRGAPSNVTRILTKSGDPERAASRGTMSRADRSFAAGSPGTPGAGREATADSSPARREGGWPSSQTPGLQNCGKINVCSGGLPRPTFPFPNCEVLFCVPSTRGATGSRVVQACPVGSALERPSRDLGAPDSAGLDGRWGSGRPAPTAPPMAGVGGARRGNATPRRGRPRCGVRLRARTSSKPSRAVTTSLPAGRVGSRSSSLCLDARLADTHYWSSCFLEGRRRPSLPSGRASWRCSTRSKPHVFKMRDLRGTWLARSVERPTPGLGVVSSRPTSGAAFT